MQIILKFRVDLPAIFRDIWFFCCLRESLNRACIPSLGRDGVGMAWGSSATSPDSDAFPAHSLNCRSVRNPCCCTPAALGRAGTAPQKPQRGILLEAKHCVPLRAAPAGIAGAPEPGQIWTSVLLKESPAKSSSWTPERLQTPQNEACGTRSGDLLPSTRDSPDVWQWQTPSDSQGLLWCRKGRFLGLTLAFLNWIKFLNA